MRESLFRGKLLDNSEWIYGNLLNHRGDDSYDVFGEVIHSGDLIIYDWTEKVDTGKYGCHYNVIPETVGQYTGLTDKNGTKIFEGDIVAIEHTRRTTFWTKIPETYKPRRSYDCHWNEKEDELLYKRNYAVEWKVKDARWILRNGSDQHDLRDVFMFFHKGIVIGNIHDNPELLKGGEG